MENFINRLTHIIENNYVGGSTADEKITRESICANVENAGGTIVFDCMDYEKDHVILFSIERHYPDTIAENRYVVLHWLHDGYISCMEQGAFDECFACLVEWSRTELADVAY